MIFSLRLRKLKLVSKLEEDSKDASKLVCSSIQSLHPNFSFAAAFDCRLLVHVQATAKRIPSVEISRDTRVTLAIF
jgi:hypothetical protein